MLVVHAFDFHALVHALLLLMPLMALNLELYHLSLCISLPVLFFELDFQLNSQSVISVQSLIFVSELSWKMAKVNVLVGARDTSWICHDFILDFG